MPEEIFYNALNIALASDYSGLADLKRRSGTWEVAYGHYQRHRDIPDPESEWKKIGDLGIQLVLRGSGSYPPLLEEIAQPPHGLYVMGNLSVAEAATIAIVGTRKGTPEGKELARCFAAELSRAGFTIISGLALGIDAAAHAGCLESGGFGPARTGKTAAVLANGLDHFYPSTNERLAKKIVEEGGAIISEYPPGAPALPYRFLERNRVVSGLSRGVLVIEAPENSGSLATARYALDQNRDVFVVPGPVSHPNYKGSNQLIRQGAELVTEPREILETYGYDAEKKSALEEKTLSAEEIHILSALRSSSRPLDVDKIIEMTTLEPHVANRLLSMLVVKNFIGENERGYTII
ncbi:MAG: DNA-processing protein DprA [Candidatus Liptonbacteria bacterium]|nr:DNA-processing protein DprA [Candidatus Liptonbacteria bacterium]